MRTYVVCTHKKHGHIDQTMQYYQQQLFCIHYADAELCPYIMM